MTKFLHDDEFNREAEAAFSFVHELGFFGPERLDDEVSFSSGQIGFSVSFDPRERAVDTIFRAFFAERNPRAPLGCLYVQAGHGPAQDVKRIARNRKQLNAVLASQASAAQKVIPDLLGAQGEDLLLRCHGRWA